MSCLISSIPFDLNMACFDQLCCLCWFFRSFVAVVPFRIIHDSYCCIVPGDRITNEVLILSCCFRSNTLILQMSSNKLSWDGDYNMMITMFVENLISELILITNWKQGL